MCRGMWRTCLPLLLLISMSCARSNDVISSPAFLSQLSLAVTGEAAISLGGDGIFRLIGPPSHEFGRPVVSEAEARSIATLAASQYGPHLAIALEEQHGSSISFAGMYVCGPSYLAHAPVEGLPGGVADDVSYYFGSYWLVAVCSSSGQPAVSVAVAATASQITITNGVLYNPPNTILLAGIQPGWQGPLPVSTENAVLLVAQRTGQRITSVPLLVAPNPCR